MRFFPRANLDGFLGGKDQFICGWARELHHGKAESLLPNAVLAHFKNMYFVLFKKLVSHVQGIDDQALNTQVHMLICNSCRRFCTELQMFLTMLKLGVRMELVAGNFSCSALKITRNCSL